jgi:hypothetical protein
MPDPLDTNDDWAELARELDRNKPPTPPPASPADMVERKIDAETIEPHHGFDSRVEEEAVAEGEAEAAVDEDFDDSEEGASTESEGEPSADGQPGTGRKRRRRRRRRRKGGASPEVAAATGSESSTESAESEPDAEPFVAEEASTESDDFGSEEGETEIIPATVEEDTASEVLRDLIASWNVPSWDDIVGGLYRPDR